MWQKSQWSQLCSRSERRGCLPNDNQRCGPCTYHRVAGLDLMKVLTGKKRNDLFGIWGGGVFGWAWTFSSLITYHLIQERTNCTRIVAPHKRRCEQCSSLTKNKSSIVAAVDYPKISDADWSIQIFFWNGPISIEYCIFRSNHVGYPCYMLTIEFPKKPTWGLTNQSARSGLKEQSASFFWI